MLAIQSPSRPFIKTGVIFLTVVGWLSVRWPTCCRRVCEQKLATRPDSQPEFPEMHVQPGPSSAPETAQHPGSGPSSPAPAADQVPWVSSVYSGLVVCVRGGGRSVQRPRGTNSTVVPGSPAPAIDGAGREGRVLNEAYKGHNFSTSTHNFSCWSRKRKYLRAKTKISNGIQLVIRLFADDEGEANGFALTRHGLGGNTLLLRFGHTFSDINMTIVKILGDRSQIYELYRFLWRPLRSLVRRQLPAAADVGQSALEGWGGGWYGGPDDIVKRSDVTATPVPHPPGQRLLDCSRRRVR